MLTIFQSASAAERLRAAGAFVERVPAATEVLVVGASRDAADDLARRVTVARGATFGLHRASLTQLAVRLAVAPATALGAEAVAARVSFEALRERALGYFAPVARFPGFARALAATLGELRLGGVVPGALDKLDGPARDVAELARRFEAQLEEGKVADRAALLAIATRALEGDSLEPLRQMPMVLLDVPIAGPVERVFVEALIKVSPAVLVTVAAGDDATLDALRSLGARKEQSDADGRHDADDLARARDFLFAAAAPPPGTARGDVLFFSAPGEGRETVEIARRILDEARAGTPFDEMAVLLRAPEVYGSLLEVALRRAGIPPWFARGTARPDPSGRAFLALLDCALEGLSARRFAEYLSLGQVPPLDAAGAPGGRAARRERLAGARRRRPPSGRRHAARAVAVGAAPGRVRRHRWQRPLEPPPGGARGGVPRAARPVSRGGGRLAARGGDRARSGEPRAPAAVRGAGDRAADGAPEKRHVGRVDHGARDADADGAAAAGAGADRARGAAPARRDRARGAWRGARRPGRGADDPRRAPSC